MMNKAQVVRVVRETALKADPKMTREDKQKVFNNVVDNLLASGKITKKQQMSWTHPF